MGERIAKGGSFPRLVESTLLVLAAPASFSFWPLDRWGHIDGLATLKELLSSLVM